MHLRIKRAPGSESPGMPASVISATFSPAARRSASSCGPHRLVVFVITHERFPDFEMPQQIPRMPRVLGRDQID